MRRSLRIGSVPNSKLHRIATIFAPEQQSKKWRSNGEQHQRRGSDSSSCATRSLPTPSICSAVGAPSLIRPQETSFVLRCDAVAYVTNLRQLLPSSLALSP